MVEDSGPTAVFTLPSSAWSTRFCERPVPLGYVLTFSLLTLSPFVCFLEGRAVFYLPLCFANIHEYLLNGWQVEGCMDGWTDGRESRWIGSWKENEWMAFCGRHLSVVGSFTIRIYYFFNQFKFEEKM